MALQDTLTKVEDFVKSAVADVEAGLVEAQKIVVVLEPVVNMAEAIARLFVKSAKATAALDKAAGIATNIEDAAEAAQGQTGAQAQ